jgi:predicted RNase H-like HicB family nuclease
MRLKGIVEPGEDRGFIAHGPALKGCWSQGTTREEALSNVREAIGAWLEVEQDKADQSGGRADVEMLNI